MTTKPDNNERRVALSPVRVAASTIRLLRELSDALKLPQGVVIDRAVQALAVAESFGGEHLRLSEKPPSFTAAVEAEQQRIRRSFNRSPQVEHPNANVVDANEVVRQFNQWKPGSPTPVNITIPHDLIRMAREYPALDWNDVMCTARDAASRSGGGE